MLVSPRAYRLRQSIEAGEVLCKKPNHTRNAAGDIILESGNVLDKCFKIVSRASHCKVSVDKLFARDEETNTISPARPCQALFSLPNPISPTNPSPNNSKFRCHAGKVLEKK